VSVRGGIDEEALVRCGAIGRVIKVKVKVGVRVRKVKGVRGRR